MIEYNEENRAKMREVADAIQGTCKGLDEVLEEVFGEGLTIEDCNILLLHELDDMTMQCESCGWWCETGELDEEQVCEDCRE